MCTKITTALLLLLSVVAYAEPSKSSANNSGHSSFNMTLSDQEKPMTRDISARVVLSKPHQKDIEMRADRVMHSLVMIPSAAQAVDKGQLNFVSSPNIDPSVFYGAAMFGALTVMTAHIDNRTVQKMFTGPAHIGPAIMDGGFGGAFAGNF